MKALKSIISLLLLISLTLGVVSCTPNEESKADTSADVSDVVSEEESTEEIIEVSGDFETPKEYEDYIRKFFMLDPPYPNESDEEELTILLDGFRECYPFHTENRDFLELDARREDGRDLRVVVIGLSKNDEFKNAFAQRYPNFKSSSYPYQNDTYEVWMGWMIRKTRVCKEFAKIRLSEFEKVNPLPKENCYTDIDKVFHYVGGTNDEDYLYTLRILVYATQDEVDELCELPMVLRVGYVERDFMFYFDREFGYYLQRMVIN